MPTTNSGTSPGTTKITVFGKSGLFFRATLVIQHKCNDRGCIECCKISALKTSTNVKCEGKGDQPELTELQWRWRFDCGKPSKPSAAQAYVNDTIRFWRYADKSHVDLTRTIVTPRSMTQDASSYSATSSCRTCGRNK